MVDQVIQTSYSEGCPRMCGDCLNLLVLFLKIGGLVGHGFGRLVLVGYSAGLWSFFTSNCLIVLSGSVYVTGGVLVDR